MQRLGDVQASGVRVDPGSRAIPGDHPPTRALKCSVCAGTRCGQTDRIGLYEDQILPRFVDLALGGRQFARLRARVAAGMEGEVLEVGFGSGRNVPFYSPAVTRVRAVDPATVGRKLAAKRLAASPVPVEYVGLDGEDLPLEDESVDQVLTTWTLCTIPDVARSLAEIRRVLRPGGTLHFLEHGRSDQPKVARWQDRLTPIQRRIAGGCHLNRPIDRLVREAALNVTRLENYYLHGPKPLGYMFEGVAVKPGRSEAR